MKLATLDERCIRKITDQLKHSSINVIDVPSLLTLPNIFSIKLRLISLQESHKDVIMVIVDENVLFIYTHN